MAELLRVEGLRKTYAAGGTFFNRKSVAALNDVSIRIERGKTLGLVGESGSGKSTLGRCILGLASPDSGTISFDGSSMDDHQGLKSEDAGQDLVQQKMPHCLRRNQRLNEEADLSAVCINIDGRHVRKEK